MPRRSGISLLETLIALVLLLIGLAPLVATFRGSFRGIQMTKEHTQAQLIAEGVLEEARARLDAKLKRYWKLADTVKDVRDKARAGDWQGMFKTLEDGPRPAGGNDPAQVSSYFARMVTRPDGTAGPVDDQADPIAARDAARFTVTVKVNFDEGGPIDTDGDGKTENDMCEIEATVGWTDTNQQPQQIKLTTVYTLADFNLARGI